MVSGFRRCRWQIFERDKIFIQPKPVRLLGRNFLFNLFVCDNPALFSINQEHPTRLQPAFLQNVFRRNIEHADFARHHNTVIFGDIVPGRTQTITIKRGTDFNAVGERDTRRAVPRFHKTGVKFVERFFLVAHAFVTGPRLRNHHHHRMRQ